MEKTIPMKFLVLIGILFLSLGQASAKVIDINLVFYEDSVHEQNVILTDKIPVEFGVGKDYVLEILDSRGETVLVRELRVPTDYIEDKINILSMRISYKEGMEILRLLHQGKEIYSRNILGYYSAINVTTTPTTTLRVFNCGNSFCDGMENHKNCPEDCPSGSRDGYCDGITDDVCDPDCYPWEDPDCESLTTTPTTLLTTILATTLPTTIPATTSIPLIAPPVSTTSTTTLPITITTTMEPEEAKEDYSFLYVPLAVLFLILVIIAALFIRRSRSKKPAEKPEEGGKLKYWLEGRLKTGENPALLKKALEKQGSDPGIVDEILQNLWKRSGAEVT